MLSCKDVVYWTEFDYSQLNELNFIKRKNRGNNIYYAENIITADAETAKYTDEILFITDWSVTIENVSVIYGNNVQDFVQFFQNIIDLICREENHRIVVYIHNYSYDYVFLKNHMFAKWGQPISALAVKPHRYVNMVFDGIEFRDSYILSQRSLENFCKDMNCESNKKVGAWDYTKFRTPKSGRTQDEIEYSLLDTIALNEAIRKLMNMHGVNVATCELTNTGFVRKEGKEAQRKKDKEWNRKFRKMQLSLEEYRALEEAYHGGYTHANRFHIGEVMENVVSYDFASSYPSTQCYEKFPMGEFKEIDDIELCDILELSNDFAFFGYIYFTDLQCDAEKPMPPIAYHKTKVCLNFLTDNGKIISAEEILIPFCDPDLEAIIDNYTWSTCKITKCWFTRKDYMPLWFTDDFVMPLYYNKCTLKKADPGLYMKSKSMLNSIYGMCVQKIIRDEVKEDYITGDWIVDKTIKNDEASEEALQKHYSSRKKYLPYQWGVWVTAYAQRNLFRLGKACEIWIYSDTDSVKGIGWDNNKLNIYNAEIERKAKERNTGIVEYDGKKFILGKAEFDGEYSEFIALGSKRYCGRESDGLHITVAGVPKSGAKQLNNDITNFRKGMIFRSEGENGTGKNQSTYINVEGIKTIEIEGETIEYGSAIRLDPCDYDLDMTFLFDSQTNLPKELIYI